jgi:hypothetical protein
MLTTSQGVLSGWWLEDSESFAVPERWNQELSKAGFAGAEAVGLDDKAPYRTIIASSPVQDQPAGTSVSLLSGQPNGPVATAVSIALERHGLAVELMGLSDDPKQDIISILDLELEGPFIAGITLENYALLQRFVSRLHGSGMLWLAKPCQIRCAEPLYAQILGLARTLRNELAVDFATLELDDPGDPDAVDAICKVYQKFLCRSKDGDVGIDYEYAFANGRVHIPRFHWISVADGLAISLSEGETPKQLEIGKRGSLKSLRWVGQSPHAQVTGNDVSVEVRAVGMNFKVFRPRATSFCLTSTDGLGHLDLYGHC